MFGRLFRRGDRAPPRIPDGERIYAIGDVHGRVDLLQDLHEMIRADAAKAPGPRCTTIYLGDLIDRGNHSRQVIDLLLTKPLPGFAAVHLLGNHEDSLLRFLDDAAIGDNWLTYGGDTTLFSYGVGLHVAGALAPMTVLQERLRAALPAAHLAFLRAMPLTHQRGDYLFVHAGIRPGVALDEQARTDLLWIRDEFLSASTDHGMVVVHGHSISRKVEMKSNRIGIDTGAYFSGRLTALVLEGETRRLLQT